jgi:hypothetical protein
MNFRARGMEPMDKSSETLFRSTLHDLANILAGVRGIIDLCPPEQALARRDRDRLGAVIEEGITVLERSRHLALGSLPEAALEPGEAWREALREELAPLGVLFRCRFDLAGPPAGPWDQWPGRQLRGYARAVTRLVLPYAKAPVLAIGGSADAQGWELRWSPAPVFPEVLLPGAEDRPMDICAHWAVRIGAAMGISLAWEPGCLSARIPRPQTGGNP